VPRARAGKPNRLKTPLKGRAERNPQTLPHFNLTESGIYSRQAMSAVLMGVAVLVVAFTVLWVLLRLLRPGRHGLTPRSGSDSGFRG
jgi:hypothetical protein